MNKEGKNHLTDTDYGMVVTKVKEGREGGVKGKGGQTDSDSRYDCEW